MFHASHAQGLLTVPAAVDPGQRNYAGDGRPGQEPAHEQGGPRQPQPAAPSNGNVPVMSHCGGIIQSVTPACVYMRVEKTLDGIGGTLMTVLAF